MKSLITVLVILATTIGCSKDVTKAPTQPQVARIELRSTHALIRGFNGEIRQAQITVTVRDGNAVGIAGQPIHFTIQDPLPWKGTLDTATFDTVTNEMGQVYVNYKVTIEQSGDVIIKATCGDVSALLTIRIELPSEVPMLSIQTTDAVLNVPPDETRQTTVTARLLNQSGEAMYGRLLLFRVRLDSMGTLDSDTATTDFGGRAIRTFTSIANHYGDCRVFVTSGDSTA